MDGSEGRGAISRRELLKRGLLGAAGLAVLPIAGAACGSAASTPSSAATPPATPAVAPTTPEPSPTPTRTPTPTPVPSPTPGGSLTIYNYLSDGGPYDRGFEAAVAAFSAMYPGITASVTRAEHGTFASAPSPANPSEPVLDVGNWFSGYRMRSFAAKGVLSPIDDLWAKVARNYAPGFAKAVTGDDGHVYGIPTDFYPWAIYYRKSVWAKRGYAVPQTWDELLALCARMRKDGLTPIAFGDKDGWPAMATFDYLDLRLNGYDFHVGLLSGRQKWTDDRVTRVLDRWRELTVHYPQGIAGLTWQQAADTLAKGTAGMYLMGSFLATEFDRVDPSGAARADLDLFPFPYFGNAFDDERAVEAPVDIIAICAQSETLAADRANAAAFLAFWARGYTQLLIYQEAQSYIPAAADADWNRLMPLDRRSVDLVASAKALTQFFDRDSRPDFAGAQGMQTFLLRFLQVPSRDLAELQRTIQDFWDSLSK